MYIPLYIYVYIRDIISLYIIMFTFLFTISGCGIAYRNLSRCRIESNVYMYVQR